MIKSLTLKNVGAMPDKTIAFGSRLNVITGDNGLGKSFLLDIIWYALTGHWPNEVNGKLSSGYMARPLTPSKEATIGMKVDGQSASRALVSVFDREMQKWRLKGGDMPMPVGLVVYAHYDGSFSVWDPERNDWSQRLHENMPDRQPAFVFTSSEVWDGYTVPDSMTGRDKWLCNGLIRDWVSWQDRNGKEFALLTDILERLSPPDFSAKITPAEHSRISIDDSREHPHIQMPYGKIPAQWASAGIRRILSLAYVLTWAMTEHAKACSIKGQAPAMQMLFLFDEVDAHLHPKWQRQIMGGILDVLERFADITKDALYPYHNHKHKQNSLGHRSSAIQMISVTHSPLVMASLEHIFDASCDKWLDIDADKKGRIVLSERPFERLGNSDDWLTSEAFDLQSTYSVEAEKAMNEASALLEDLGPHDAEAIKKAYQNLLKTLNPKDAYLCRFRYICEKKKIKLKDTKESGT
ncbi:MAG: AAA family ATPase [Victivallales bacterium]|nr:AAA family ATPase [Victivallales bacterium]